MSRLDFTAKEHAVKALAVVHHPSHCSHREAMEACIRAALIEALELAKADCEKGVKEAEAGRIVEADREGTAYVSGFNAAVAMTTSRLADLIAGAS